MLLSTNIYFDMKKINSGSSLKFCRKPSRTLLRSPPRSSRRRSFLSLLPFVTSTHFLLPPSLPLPPIAAHRATAAGPPAFRPTRFVLQSLLSLLVELFGRLTRGGEGVGGGVRRGGRGVAVPFSHPPPCAAGARRPRVRSIQEVRSDPSPILV
jgi:hypothetical protein